MPRRDAPALEVRDVTMRFGGLTALANVSMRVPRGSVVGLIGPNGAGKTTTFNVITGVYRPTAGRVRLFGDDVTDLPQHQRAQLGVARSFQKLELFATMTVRENLVSAFEARYGRGDVLTDILRLPATLESRWEAEQQVDDVLTRSGLRPYADTPAGDLPLGVARLVEFARAYVQRPELLLLDEPNSGLRGEESERLARLIREARDAGTAVLLVEHDMSFVLGLSDHVYVLDFGRMLADGTPADVRANPEVQAAYLGEEVHEDADAEVGA